MAARCTYLCSTPSKGVLACDRTRIIDVFPVGTQRTYLVFSLATNELREHRLQPGAFIFLPQILDCPPKGGDKRLLTKSKWGDK